MTAATTSELRIPADPAYIVVAKRAAASFGYIAGFGVEAVDELTIAIAQACENAIRCVRSGGTRSGQLRLSFRLEDQRLEVRVQSSCGRAEERSEVREPAGTRAISPAPPEREHRDDEARVHDLALRMMGLFVDDCRYRVDERTGGLRVRLTKYRIS